MPDEGGRKRAGEDRYVVIQITVTAKMSDVRIQNSDIAGPGAV
jgi:hypothetical protein